MANQYYQNILLNNIYKCIYLKQKYQIFTIIQTIVFNFSDSWFYNLNYLFFIFTSLLSTNKIKYIYMQSYRVPRINQINIKIYKV